ncbi:MAG: hypothetical protein QM731_09615 [Chitinophagaceae bacterium]
MQIMDRPWTHVFYHADRSGTLKEGQEIVLDHNNLSYFGRSYWSIISTKSVDEMDESQQREYYLEMVRQEREYSLYASRMQSIFAANSIAEAIVFANSIEPRSEHPIPIVEIFADRFWSLDSNWLDFKDSPDRRIANYYSYWDAHITNHCPERGDRRAPRLEVMIALPATAGKIVYVVE